jgi:hypothetical protein
MNNINRKENNNPINYFILTVYRQIVNISINNFIYKALMRKSNYVLEIKRGNAGGNFP